MLDKKLCEVLVCNLVLSHLDYANGNLYGVGSYLLKRMQKIQNYAARVILQVDQKFNSLQALFKIALLAYQGSHKVQIVVHNSQMLTWSI